MGISVDKELWEDLVWGCYTKARNLAVQEGIEDWDIYFAMHFGPAHIIWEDHSFKLEDINWCLDNFERFTGNHSDECLRHVRNSLLDLVTIYKRFVVEG